jgi:coenzyme F420-0:L-glutamate ligase / coenzyme F420-1:gamma-L-glutamate ligase
VTIELLPVPVAGEITAGADLAALVLASAPPLEDDDVLVVAHKAVAKAEGRTLRLADVEPSELARRLAGEDGDPRQLEVVLREARRIVRSRGGLLICETEHGFVCANAGVDRSNASEPDSVVLLPRDPDASARALRAALEERTGRRLAVVVADTHGRAWRVGIAGVAIGVAGLRPLQEHAGARDPAGYELRTSTVAVADELAAAADLVMQKTARIPAVVVRGFAGQRGEGSAAELVRDPASDLFR